MNWDGFIITALPNANAGQIFRIGVETGKFQGLMQKITPRGRRKIWLEKLERPFAIAIAPILAASPTENRPSAQDFRVSPLLSRKSLPCSSVPAVASRSAFASTASINAFNLCERSRPGIFAHFACAMLALSITRPRSSRAIILYRPIFSVGFAGFSVSKTSSPTPYSYLKFICFSFFGLQQWLLS